MGEAAALAAQVASLQRLWFEYRRTSRRARALEDVLLPEIKQNLSVIDAGLEEQDREEAIRVRHFKQLLER
jgi:V/A-type H+-transporting ATPase subunit D